MNRKKKINSILKKRLKKQNAKMNKPNKPKYISKAERERQEALEASGTTEVDSQTAENEAESEIAEKTETA